jgi:pimeloyl-ACP methyl ester carboxylesterase
MRNLTLEAALPTIHTPVLVIAGGTDSLLPSNVADAALLGNGVLHVLSSAGHEVARDDPQGVADAIHNFVQGHTKSRKVIAAELALRIAEFDRSSKL